MQSIFSELYDLMKESLNEKEREEDLIGKTVKHEEKNMFDD